MSKAMYLEKPKRIVIWDGGSNSDAAAKLTQFGILTAHEI